MARYSADSVIGAQGWHTMGVPPGAMKAKASGGATPATYQDVGVMSFSGSAINRVRWLARMPKSWDLEEIKFAVSGVIDTGGSGGANTVWKLAAKAFGHDDAAWTTADLSTGAQIAEAPWTADDDVLMSPKSPEITVDGTPAEGDLVLFELWRDPTHANDNTTAAFLLTQCDVYIKLNKPEDV